jgi:hypothetical protein
VEWCPKTAPVTLAEEERCRRQSSCLSASGAQQGGLPMKMRKNHYTKKLWALKTIKLNLLKLINLFFIILLN